MGVVFLFERKIKQAQHESNLSHLVG